jgi:hypothetical protein
MEVVDYLKFIQGSKWIVDEKMYFTFEWLMLLANGLNELDNSQYSTLVGSPSEIDGLFAYLNSTQPWQEIYGFDSGFLNKVRQDVRQRPCIQQRNVIAS